MLTSVVLNTHISVFGRLADDRHVKVPLVEYLGDLARVIRGDDDEHPLLALGEHDLVRRHARLAPGDLRHVDADARAAFIGRLYRRRGQPGGSQVLESDETARLGELQTRLDQDFFEERVAHLHGGTELAVVLEAPRREAGGAVNAVTSGVGPYQHEEVARRPGRGAEELVSRNDAHAHRVDERVVGVGIGEDDLAADVGNADAVAVLRDACNDSSEKITVPRGVGLSEPE